MCRVRVEGMCCFPAPSEPHSDFEVGIVFQDVRLTRKLANIMANGDDCFQAMFFDADVSDIVLPWNKIITCWGAAKRVSSAPRPVGFEFRRVGSSKPATEVTGFLDSVVPPAGCPRAAGAARFRCVAPLLACCAGKRFAFPQLRTLSGSNPGISVAKSPSPRGYGLLILNGAPSGIRTRDIHLERVASLAARRWGQRERVLADFFAGAYIVGKLETTHRSRLSIPIFKHLNL